MINVGLEFQLGISEVIGILMDLPGPMKPQHYSDAEAKPAERLPIGESTDFIRKMKSRKGGVFLYGSQVTYSLRGVGDKVVCDGFAEVDHSVIERIFSGPFFGSCYFGYACLSEELNARNRLVVQRGINSIEAWVGRDTAKVVPGIYWITLLSKALIDQLGVEVEKVAAEAMDSWVISDTCFVFEMGETPEQWRGRVGNGRLASETWLFDVAKAKADVDKAQDLLSAIAVLGRWK